MTCDAETRCPSDARPPPGSRCGPTIESVCHFCQPPSPPPRPAGSVAGAACSSVNPCCQNKGRCSSFLGCMQDKCRFMPPPADAELQQADPWDRVREAIDDSGIEAAILTVVVNDTVVFAHLVGGVTDGTQQEIWSASKLVASAAIMREVERGGLGLNDLVSQHLSFWPTDSSDSRSAITLRHLLGFASGYTDGTQTWGYILPLGCLTGDIQTCARGVLDQREHTHEAGKIIDYNSIHLAIAGAMVEAAVGVNTFFYSR
jgi:CubicO group peptidase (beta-lactamase class C family)